MYGPEYQQYAALRHLVLRAHLPQVLKLCIDMASGLEYLHPTIIHRDLKPANVLVNGAFTDQMVAKLSVGGYLVGYGNLGATTYGCIRRRAGAGSWLDAGLCKMVLAYRSARHQCLTPLTHARAGPAYHNIVHVSI